MNEYSIINYDVWGNKAGGFEVNQAFYTTFKIVLSDNYSDKEIRQALFKSGYCSKGILLASLDINDTDSCIYITLTGSRYGYKPFCELRKQDS